MKKSRPEEKIASFFKIIDHPIRIRILFAIGDGETCVCHLETVLGLRQAYISQHLMELRKNGILDTNREGKFIYYRLSSPKILDIIRITGILTKTSLDSLERLTSDAASSNCCCPKCSEARLKTNRDD